MTTLSPKMNWWWWRINQMRLTKWTLALLQGRKYTVKIEDTGSGSCDLKNLVIRVNAQIAPEETVEIQFRLTQGILAHEVGHAFFTDAWPDKKSGTMLLDLVNILEDERIERAVGILYPGVVPVIHQVGDLFLGEFSPLEFKKMEANLQVFNLSLIWRWEQRKVKMTEIRMLKKYHIQEAGRELWTHVQPLVEEAWQAANTSEVIRIAEDILNILDISNDKEASSSLFSKGGFGEDIPTGRLEVSLPLPSGEAGISPGVGTSEVFISGTQPAAGLGTPKSKPAMYTEWEDKALPLARVLSESLNRPLPDQRPMPHEYRGRYNARQEIRTPEQPHLVQQAVENSAGDLTLYIMVDRSGSMSGMNYDVRLALMTLYLAATDLEIPTGIAYFGQHTESPLPRNMYREICPIRPMASEETKAWIAGYAGTTGAEYLYWSMLHAEQSLLQCPERKKIMIIIHDGNPVYAEKGLVDWKLSFSHLRKMDQKGINPIGLFLGKAGSEDCEMCRNLFPRFVQTESNALANTLGNLLRSLY
ncbi:MAG: hypothetical protein JEZ06_08955 [Anaerolineaceae bacterium]|nr:hypothetical protein [Anaerolineaceae bacterium]